MRPGSASNQERNYSSRHKTKEPRCAHHAAAADLIARVHADAIVFVVLARPRRLLGAVALEGGAVLADLEVWTAPFATFAFVAC